MVSQNYYFERPPPPPPTPYVRVWMTGTPLSQGLDPALECVSLCNLKTLLKPLFKATHYNFLLACLQTLYLLFRDRRARVWKWHFFLGSYNLEEVLNFRGRFEKSLNSIKVREKYLIPLLGLEKVLEINSLVYATHFLWNYIISPRKIWLNLSVRTCKTHG